MATALITGSTSGIGRGFTEHLARRGMDLILVSRDQAALERQALDLRTEFGVQVEILQADLAVRTGTDQVAARLADAQRPVAVLVNNAGFGLRDGFVESSVEDEQALLDVMVVAVMRLTHAAIPGMVERGRGVVINVSSIASFMTSGTYAAAKSWVTVFSEGLADELQGTGVRVTAVCPGFVHTQFHDRAGMDMSSVPPALWLEVGQVVDQAMRDVARGRSVSIAGLQYRAIAHLFRHGPRRLVRTVSSQRRRSR